MRIGTSHFVSRLKAIRYYSDYEVFGGVHNAANLVDCKIAEGDIHIGAPSLKPGQRLTVIDNGTRYAIEEGE